MKTTYVYTPTPCELFTRQTGLNLKKGDKVQLSEAPAGGKGLPGRFKWVQDMNGNFLGMVLKEALVKE